MFNFLGQLALQIKKLLLPFTCIACESVGNYICRSCLDSVPIRRNNLCPRCEKNNTLLGEVCQACLMRRGYYLDGVLVATYYDHPIASKLIKDFKFLGFKENAKYLAEILSKKIKLSPGFLLEESILVGVPIHLKKFRLRGFNQTELILEELQKLMAKDAIKIKTDKEIILKNIFHTAQSKTKSMTERRKNVKNTFAVNEKKKIPQNIIILDDVMTTGATLNEMARVLKNGGAKNVWGLIVAREIFI